MKIARIATATVSLAALAAAPLFAFTGAAEAQTCQGKHFFATYNNQVINGTCGNDTIEVGRWHGVKVHAGAGNDEVKAGYNGGTTTVYLGSGNDEVWTSSNSEKTVVAYGEAGNDVMNGGGKGDYLSGGIGTDTINGWGGSDTLYGNGGNDTFHSQSSTPLYDYVYGGTGIDKATVDKTIDWLDSIEHVTAL